MKRRATAGPYTLYWGDLHSHCAVSYGYGTYERALACAREQLDFCSVTGHAFWPDMPTDRARYGRIIDYHNEGFARCAANWPAVQRTAAANDQPGVFVPFLSYEWHSLAFGDHNVYYRDLQGPLLDGRDLDDLESRLLQTNQPFMLVPHHIGYGPGRRGINWEHFKERRSPLVEIFSLHGCSESEHAPYPLYHTMGPRDPRGTAAYGIKQGHKFGLIGSTDHHGGFPGSYGDGLVGVWAKELTREALWEAFISRRTCAASGDKIACLLTVDGAMPGESITTGAARRLEVHVEGQDAIEFIDVLKNERVIRRIQGPHVAWDGTLGASKSGARPDEWKIRIEWGWGERPNRAIVEGTVRISGGELVDVTPCFRGETILSPDDDAPGSDEVPHRILHTDPSSCSWRSLVWANPSPRQPETQALVLTARLEKRSSISIKMNGWNVEVPLERLAEGSVTHNFRGWLSESVRVHQAIPSVLYTVSERFEDRASGAVDVYRLRVAQRNGQWAWTSPIWAAF